MPTVGVVTGLPSAADLDARVAGYGARDRTPRLAQASRSPVQIMAQAAPALRATSPLVGMDAFVGCRFAEQPVTELSAERRPGHLSAAW